LKNRVKLFDSVNLTISCSYTSRGYYTFFMPQVPKYDLKPLHLGDKTIGQRIAYFRKKRGLTQTELAEIIGISQKLVAAYEKSYIRLYDEMIARFALALKVSADDLLGIKNKNNNEPLPSLRVMRRFKEIDSLSESRKKAILKTLDDLIRANS